MDLNNRSEQTGLHYMYRGSGKNSRLSWSSISGWKENTQEPVGKEFEKLGEEINKMPHQPISIFKSVNPASWFSVTPQRTIERLKSLQVGEDIVMFDFENIGTFGGNKSDNLKWYSPTELAMGRRKVGQDFRLLNDPREVSLFIKPTDDVFSHIDGLIQKVKGMGSRWKGMTSDEYRTLNDLILYGANNPFDEGYFSKSETGATYLNRQLRSEQAPIGFHFNQEQIRRMEKGRHNLEKFGSTADQVVMEMDKLFGDAGNIRLMGYNIDKYDVPMMLDFIDNNLGKNVKDSKVKQSLQRLRSNLKNAQQLQQLDIFQVIKTVYRDQASVFGKNLKQEQVAEMFGLNKKAAHMGISDVHTSTDIWNHLVSKEGLMSSLNSGRALSASWNESLYQPDLGRRRENKGIPVADSRLFSISGMASFNAGKFDMVFNEDMTPAYGGSFRPNPLYKNTEYILDKTGKMGIFDKDTQETKQYYTALLKNQDDGLFHFFARETEEDLLNIFHQHMVPMEDVSPVTAQALKDSTHMDRVRRSYLKMYSEDGGSELIRRMYKGLDEYDKWKGKVGQGKGYIKEETLKEKVLKAAGYTDKSGRLVSANPEVFRNIEAMQDRLRGERGIVMPFLDELDKSPLQDDRSAKGVALGQFKSLLDAEFGRNESSMDLGAGNEVVTIMQEGKLHQISLKDTRSIESNIKSLIRSGYDGTPSIRVVKQRLLSMIRELRAQGMGKETESDLVKGKSGLSHSAAKQLEYLVNNLKEGDQYQTLLAEISGRLKAAHDHDKQSGLNRMGSRHITVENPFTINEGRAKALAEGIKDGRVSSIMQQSIGRAMPFASKAWIDGKINIDDPFLNTLLKDHQNVMSTLHKDAGGSKMAVTDIKNTLSNLASSFAKDDLAVSFIYDDRHKGLVMAIADKKVAQTVFKLAPNEIIENSKVATVGIPLLSEGGNLRMPGIERAGRLMAIERNEQMVLGSGSDVVIQSLMRMSRSIRGRIAEGDVLGARNSLRRVASNQMKSLSINNKRMADLDDILDYDTKKSKLVRWGRAGYIDMSGFAEKWYNEKYGADAYKEKLTRMQRDYSLGFIDTLSMKELGHFNRDVDDWANRIYGLKTNMHSVKDVHAGNAIRSTVSYQEVSPFGYFDGMARENMSKVVNYLPLDRDRTIRGLQDANFSPDKIKSLMTRGLVTDTFSRVTEGEVNYLNLRAAYLDDVELARLTGDATASTFEGVSIMADDVAKGYTMVREKRLQLAEGSMLDEQIQKLFNNFGDADDNGNLRVDQRASEAQRNLFAMLGLGDQNGLRVSEDKVTVGFLNKKRIEYEGNSRRVLVKGLDKEKNQLILEEIDGLEDGDKIVTTSGDRSTVTIQPRAWFDKHGIVADTVFARPAIGKEFHGAYIRSQVELVINEALKQIDKKFTVGDANKQQAINSTMETLANLMETHLKVPSIKVLDGQLQMSGLFGRDGKSQIALSVTDPNKVGTMGDLRAFMQAAQGQLGIENFLDSKIEYGQVGVALGDVYKWHNAIGRKDARNNAFGAAEGLVRWTPKEVEAISQRARKYIDGESAVAQWSKDYVNASARLQNEGIDTFTQGLIRASLDLTDDDLRQGNLRSGEVVISTQNRSFSVEAPDGSIIVDDRQGQSTARRTSNGITEVSLHAFNDVPEIGYVGHRRSSKDYAGTVASIGSINPTIYDGQGNLLDESLKEAIRSNSGTALFQLPDNSFGRNYVRFINTDVTGIPVSTDEDMAVLTQLQRSQVNIADLTKRYQASPTTDLHADLSGAIRQQEQLVSRLVSSARKGSILDQAFSAKLDMSGRFIVQTVNPIAASSYKEGTLYVGQERMMQMISGAEADIARNIFNINTEGMESTDIKNTVLAKIKENGLYGFVNRYPTIHESTNMVLNVMIDDTLGTKRTGRMTVGTATILNADSDGDFLSNVFAHYKSENAARIHDEMAQIHQGSLPEFNDMRLAIEDELKSEAKLRGTTVGDLWNDADFRKQWNENAKVGGLYDRESAIARLGKSDVGPLDNLRLKLSNAAQAAHTVLQGEGIWDAGTVKAQKDIIDEFGRMISQKAISSKKFSVRGIRTEIEEENARSKIVMSQDQMNDAIQARMNQRDYAIEILKQGINTADQGLIREANSIIGIFKDKAGDGQRFDLSQMLDSLTQTHQLYGETKSWLNNPHLNMFVSDGLRSPEDVSNMLAGRSGPAIPTPVLQRLAGMNQEVAENMAGNIESFRASILSNYGRMTGDTSKFSSMLAGSSASLSAEMLEGATVADEKAVRFSELANKFMSSVPGGRAGFGAMQLGGAMFAGMWGISALMRNGPTPEETTRGSDGQIAEVPIKGVMSSPTARITPNENGESIQISVSAKDAQRMSQEQISAMIHGELNAMMPMALNMNLNVQDNTQNMDQQYLQNIVSQALNGRIF